jgi:4,5-DOPA dioxygenase extradiol
MTHRYPSLFLSHGAPDIAIIEHEAVDAFRKLGRRFAKPAAIVVVSAHWTSDPVGLTASAAPDTIHDFGGFPESLYRLRYPAKGDPELATAIAGKLRHAGLRVELDTRRGLDHGAWIPLLLMYPDADIPVIQVSLPKGGMDLCIRMGEAMASLGEEGVLVIGSGGSVHNLRELNRHDLTAPWALAFEQWLFEAIEGNHFDRLVDPEKLPEEFTTAHPTIEHYMPLVVAWAAGDRDHPGRRIHQSFMYGNVGMSFYEFAA